MPSLRDIRRAQMQHPPPPPPTPQPTTWFGSVVVQAENAPTQISEFVASVILSQIMTRDDDAAFELAVQRSEEATEPVQSTVSHSMARDVLEPRRWSRGYARDDDPAACPICMETFKYPKRVARLKCGHLYCSTCIRKWITGYSDRCPVCRDYVGLARASPPSGEEAPSARPADAGLQVEV